jgi:hypothetical protein
VVRRWVEFHLEDGGPGEPWAALECMRCGEIGPADLVPPGEQVRRDPSGREGLEGGALATDMFRLRTGATRRPAELGKVHAGAADEGPALE